MSALMLAVLTHDMGKPACTREEIKHGRRCIVSPGHDEAGGPVAELFLNRINAPLIIRQPRQPNPLLLRLWPLRRRPARPLLGRL